MNGLKTSVLVLTVGLCASRMAVAGVFYPQEAVDGWFSFSGSGLTTASLQTAPWTPPTDGEAAVAEQKITLDTDFDDMLVYTPTAAGTTVQSVDITMEVSACAEEPQIEADDVQSDVQSALCVINTGSGLQWSALVGDGSGGSVWQRFDIPGPEEGSSYVVRVESSSSAQVAGIRYSVKAEGAPEFTVLQTANGVSWFPKVCACASITRLGFSGYGSVSEASATKTVPLVASFGSTSYRTFAEAVAAAGVSETPIELLWNAAYAPTADGTVYVRKNGYGLSFPGHSAAWDGYRCDFAASDSPTVIVAYRGELTGPSANFSSNIAWENEPFPTDGSAAAATVTLSVPAAQTLTLDADKPAFGALGVNGSGKLVFTGSLPGALTLGDGLSLSTAGTTVAAGDKLVVDEASTVKLCVAKLEPSGDLITWSTAPAGSFKLFATDPVAGDPVRELVKGATALKLQEPAEPSEKKTYFAADEGAGAPFVPVQNAWIEAAVGQSEAAAVQTAMLTKPATSTLTPMQAYLLGFEAEASKTAKPYVSTAQIADSAKVRVSVAGLPEATRAGATVAYKLVAADNVGFTGATETPMSGNSVDVDLPAAGVKYFRVDFAVAP